MTHRRPGGLRALRGRLVGLALLACACQPPAQLPPARPAPPTAFLLSELAGGWHWTLRTSDAGTTTIESETWRLVPTPGVPTQLSGRYLREVEVRSDDRVPFGCNQRPWYRLRTIYDVTVEPGPAGLTVRETGYRNEPSPCERGFRRLAAYIATAAGDRMTLRWDGGSQTLWQLDSELAELPAAPWTAGPELTGAWRWDATTYDDAGNLRDESEWWEVTRRGDHRLDASYRRRVTVRSPDGALIPCAGAASWSFDDAYVVDGEREAEHWHLHERAADPGDHPCLQATPRRSLDEATAEQIGDFLVLEWRGKRREVLYRPE